MTADLDSLQQASSDSSKTNSLPVASSLDEPIDALVYDVHPAFVVQDEDIYRPMQLFSLQTEPAKYKVPQRFGMSAILGIMTALALLFGGFHVLNAEPVVYLFFGLLTLVICVAQMFNAKAPRAASVFAGAILGPIFMPRVFASDLPSWGTQRAIMIGVLTVFGLPVGALLGYLTGACAAGIFLVMDYWEPYLQGYSLDSHSSARPAAQ
jgi:hypothetical protein